MRSFGFDSHRPLEKVFWGRPERQNQQKAGALYRARTVHLWTTLRPPGLALNEKQIPRFVGNNGNASRKWNAWNELSCAQGRRATRLRYAPTRSALLILKHFPTSLLLQSPIWASTGVNPKTETSSRTSSCCTGDRSNIPVLHFVLQQEDHVCCAIVERRLAERAVLFHNFQTR